MGENDWIDEEGEEKKVELFLKWNIQLMSCWSKRKDLTQATGSTIYQVKS